VPEKYDNVRSFEQVRAAPSVRAMPVIVLTADQPQITAKGIASGQFPSEVTANFAEALWAAQMPAQDSLARLFPNAKHITNTNEEICRFLTRPDTVAKETTNRSSIAPPIERESQGSPISSPRREKPNNTVRPLGTRK